MINFTSCASKPRNALRSSRINYNRGRVYGSKATFSCTQSGKPPSTGNTVLMCQSNGRWSGAAPSKCSVGVGNIVWHPTVVNWGTMGKSRIGIVDYGTPQKGTQQQYNRVCANVHGINARVQYPGEGTDYATAGTTVFQAARTVAQGTMHEAFPQATAGTVLVLHGSKPSCWACSQTDGLSSMLAWKGAHENIRSNSKKYAWCRDCNRFARRYHVYVCSIR